MKNKEKLKKFSISIVIITTLITFVVPNYSNATLGAGTVTKGICLLFDAIQHLIIHAAIPVMTGTNGIVSLDVMGDNGTEVSSMQEIAEITKRELNGTASEEEYKNAYYSLTKPSNWSGVSIDQNDTELGRFGIPRCIVTPYEIFTGRIPMLDANYFKNDTNEIEAKNTIKENIRSWYNTFRIIAILGLLCVLIYLGIRMIISASVTDKVKYKNMLVDWVVALCLIFCLNYIMSFTMNMVDYIVEAIGAESEEEYNANGGGEFIIEITGMWSWKAWSLPKETPRYAPINTVGYLRILSTMNEGDNINELMYAIAYAIATVITLIFLFTYYKRFLTLTFLTFISPLVALTYPIDKIKDGKAQAFNYWLREYITNAALPIIHIILYKVFIKSVPELIKSAPLYVVFVMAFMLSAEKIIKSMFGVKGETAPPPSIAGATIAGNMVSKLSSEAGNILGNGGKKVAKLTSDSGGSAPKPTKGGKEIFDESGSAPSIPGGMLTSIQGTNSRQTQPGQSVPQTNNPVTYGTRQSNIQMGNPQQTQTGNIQQIQTGNNTNNNSNSAIDSLRNRETAMLNRNRANEYYNNLPEEQQRAIRDLIPEEFRDNPSPDNISDAMEYYDRTHSNNPLMGNDNNIENRYNRQRQAIQNGNPEYIRAAHYYQGMNENDRNNYLNGVARPEDSNFDINNSEDFVNGVTGENGFLAANPGVVDNGDFEDQVNMANIEFTNDEDLPIEPIIEGEEPLDISDIGKPTLKNNAWNLITKRKNIPAGTTKEQLADLGEKFALKATKTGLKAYLMLVGGMTGGALALAMAAGSGKDPGEIMSSAVTGTFTGISTGKSIGNAAKTKIDNTTERVKDDVAYLKNGEDFEKEIKKAEFLKNRSNYYEVQKRVMAEKGYKYNTMTREQKSEVRKATNERMQDYWDYNDELGGNASMKELHRMDDIRRDIAKEERDTRSTQGMDINNEEINRIAKEDTKRVARLKNAGGYNSSNLMSRKKRNEAKFAIKSGYENNNNYTAEQTEYASRRMLGRLDYLTGVSDKINRNAI